MEAVQDSVFVNGTNMILLINIININIKNPK